MKFRIWASDPANYRILILVGSILSLVFFLASCWIEGGGGGMDYTFATLTVANALKQGGWYTPVP
ncbi:MAG: hypothetical protein JW934_16410 [Anaerolineae bacterium]|nr:hypothetical protein [Anaerolineae bacterium]